MRSKWKKGEVSGPRDSLTLSIMPMLMLHADEEKERRRLRRLRREEGGKRGGEGEDEDHN